MDIRAIWEALSIGKVSLVLNNEDMLGVTIVWGVFSLIHLIAGIFGDYTKHNDPSRIWKSMYCIFYIPILVLVSCFEFLLLVQFSFHSTVFSVAVIILGIYEIVKGIITAVEERAPNVLGIMQTTQVLGCKMTKHKKWFFEDSILTIKAIRDIKRKQNKALKWNSGTH